MQKIVSYVIITHAVGTERLPVLKTHPSTKAGIVRPLFSFKDHSCGAKDTCTPLPTSLVLIAYAFHALSRTLAMTFTGAGCWERRRQCSVEERARGD